MKCKSFMTDDVYLQIFAKLKYSGVLLFILIATNCSDSNLSLMFFASINDERSCDEVSSPEK